MATAIESAVAKYRESSPQAEQGLRGLDELLLSKNAVGVVNAALEVGIKDAAERKLPETALALFTKLDPALLSRESYQSAYEATIGSLVVAGLGKKDDLLPQAVEAVREYEDYMRKEGEETKRFQDFLCSILPGEIFSALRAEGIEKYVGDFKERLNQGQEYQFFIRLTPTLKAQVARQLILEGKDERLKAFLDNSSVKFDRGTYQEEPFESETVIELAKIQRDLSEGKTDREKITRVEEGLRKGSNDYHNGREESNRAYLDQSNLRMIRSVASQTKDPKVAEVLGVIAEEYIYPQDAKYGNIESAKIVAFLTVAAAYQELEEVEEAEKWIEKAIGLAGKGKFFKRALANERLIAREAWESIYEALLERERETEAREMLTNLEQEVEADHIWWDGRKLLGETYLRLAAREEDEKREYLLRRALETHKYMFREYGGDFISELDRLGLMSQAQALAKEMGVVIQRVEEIIWDQLRRSLSEEKVDIQQLVSAFAEEIKGKPAGVRLSRWFRFLEEVDGVNPSQGLRAEASVKLPLITAFAVSLEEDGSITKWYDDFPSYHFYEYLRRIARWGREKEAGKTLADFMASIKQKIVAARVGVLASLAEDQSSVVLSEQLIQINKLFKEELPLFEAGAKAAIYVGTILQTQ